MKNIQLKTTVVLLVVSSILLSGVSLINIYNINNISENINSSEIMQVIARSKSTLELVWVISIVLFSIFSIIFINNILKVITKPLSNIVDNAGKFGDDNEIKYLEEAKKSTDDKFSKTINSMTEELRQNLDSVNKQKNQTEAILLHIKDGIISVDLNGNVTYINPAAINFFDLTQDDNTFDKIFKKIGLDVNLEKIVYLDDLTSSEQKVFINEKYITRYNRTCKIR